MAKGSAKQSNQAHSAKQLSVDVVIMGGGLAGSLTAFRYKIAKPDLKILLIEGSKSLGGQKTFSFHETDLTSESLEWMKEFISASWNEVTVRFPRVERTLPGRYYSFRSEDLHRIVNEKLGKDILFNAKVEKATESKVILEDGTLIDAGLVLDARGIDEIPPVATNGYQKFFGYDLLLEEPHGLTNPLLMDAICPQLDGFRFFYLLPWDEKRLLIEETYYSDTSDLNIERISRSIRSYAERHGWKIKKIEREEKGVLPIPMTAASIQTSMSGEPLLIGGRSGFYHATTGYSLPDAVRFAEYLISLPEQTTQKAREGLLKFRRAFLSKQRFYRMLNRMLFHACEPSLRYQVLQHFYQLPQDLIERFYAGRTTWRDRFRILSGRPPVPVERALKSFREGSLQMRAGVGK